MKHSISWKKWHVDDMLLLDNHFEMARMKMSQKRVIKKQKQIIFDIIYDYQVISNNIFLGTS